MFIKRGEKCGLTGVFCIALIMFLKGVKMTLHPNEWVKKKYKKIDLI